MFKKRQPQENSSNFINEMLEKFLKDDTLSAIEISEYDKKIYLVKKDFNNPCGFKKD